MPVWEHDSPGAGVYLALPPISIAAQGSGTTMASAAAAAPVGMGSFLLFWDERVFQKWKGPLMPNEPEVHFPTGLEFHLLHIPPPQCF